MKTCLRTQKLMQEMSQSLWWMMDSNRNRFFDGSITSMLKSQVSMAVRSVPSIKTKETGMVLPPVPLKPRDEKEWVSLAEKLGINTSLNWSVMESSSWDRSCFLVYDLRLTRNFTHSIETTKQSWVKISHPVDYSAPFMSQSLYHMPSPN